MVVCVVRIVATCYVGVYVVYTVVGVVVAVVLDIYDSAGVVVVVVVGVGYLYCCLRLFVCWWLCGCGGVGVVVSAICDWLHCVWCCCCGCGCRCCLL